MISSTVDIKEGFDTSVSIINPFQSGQFMQKNWFLPFTIFSTPSPHISKNNGKTNPFVKMGLNDPLVCKLQVFFPEISRKISGCFRHATSRNNRQLSEARQPYAHGGRLNAFLRKHCHPFRNSLARLLLFFVPLYIVSYTYRRSGRCPAPHVLLKK